MSTEVRVYLDPSVISALFDSRAVDRQRMTAALWETLGDYRVYISEIVLDELGAAPEGLRSSYLEAVKGFSVLRVTEEAEQLAGITSLMGYSLRSTGLMPCTWPWRLSTALVIS